MLPPEELNAIARYLPDQAEADHRAAILANVLDWSHLDG